VKPFGSIPRALGFKRKPHPDVARLLDVLNEVDVLNDEQSHVDVRDAWQRIVDMLRDDLAYMRALECEHDHVDELSAGALVTPYRNGCSYYRWQPPFDVPRALAGSPHAQQDYFAARRALWLLWTHDAAHLVRRCSCGSYVFAREACNAVRCRVRVLRYERRYAEIRTWFAALWSSEPPRGEDEDVIGA
jgi:hypothetical protein